MVISKIVILFSIMRSVFEDDTVNETCSQNNCEKWDSLHHLNLISELEDEFDVEFEPKEIVAMRGFTAIRDTLITKL